MKIEKQKAKFTPLTITIETQEEYDALWASLNTSYVEVCRHKRQGTDFSAPVKHAMWDMVDRAR